MLRKQSGLRGLDGSLLARLREYTRRKYGKTKDVNGSIAVQIINGLLSDFLQEIQEGEGVAEKVIKKLYDSQIKPTDNPAAVIGIIRDIAKTTDLPSIIEVIGEIEHYGYFKLGEALCVVRCAERLYGSRIPKKHYRRYEDLGMFVRGAQ